MSRHAARPVILSILLLDAIGFGLVLPIVPSLVAEVLHRPPADISRYYGMLMFSYAFMQFICAPLLGRLSDWVGRRPIILFTLAIAVVDYLISATTGSLAWLVIARLIAGACGANISTASAYLTDITPIDKRAQAFGAMGATLGLGFVIGPLISAALSEFGVRMPFLFGAGMSLLAFVGAFLLLGESLPREHRRPLLKRDLNPLLSLLNLRQPKLFALSGALFCWYLASACVTSVWVLFAYERFGWSEAQTGISLAAWGLLSMIGQGMLPAMVIPRFGERRTVLFGMWITIATQVLFGLTQQGWQMYAVMLLSVFGMVGQPALYAALSRQVGPGEQGELQGALRSVYSLSLIFGPLIATSVFAYFIRDSGLYVPGAPFFLSGACIAVGLICARGGFASAALAAEAPDAPASLTPVPHADTTKQAA